MPTHPMAPWLGRSDAFRDVHNQSAADDLSRENWLGPAGRP